MQIFSCHDIGKHKDSSAVLYIFYDTYIESMRSVWTKITYMDEKMLTHCARFLPPPVYMGGEIRLLLVRCASVFDRTKNAQSA